MSHLGWLALPVFLILAWFKPRLGDSWLGAVETLGARFAVKRRAVLVAAPLAVIALRLALFPVLPLPTPTCHDKFSYLLAGDTFAHARLTNPSHPMWLFLDTFHVLQHPTYASIFPPGQGVALALGEVLGHPWIGVLLSMAFMTAALTWMLQGWLPARWALLGVVLIISNRNLQLPDGELLGRSSRGHGRRARVGSSAADFKYYRSRDALIMGAGAFLLANSRPYEGFLFCVPVGIAMIAWLWSSRSPAFKITGQRILLPLLCMLALTALSVGCSIRGSRAIHFSCLTHFTTTNTLTTGCSFGRSSIRPYTTRTSSSNYISTFGSVARIVGARTTVCHVRAVLSGQRALRSLCRGTPLDDARPPGSISLDPARFQHAR